MQSSPNCTSLTCTVAQLAQTLRHVSNEHTVPVETLVVDSNLAVTNCIEMDQNVCIGIVGYTGIEPYSLPRLNTRGTSWTHERQWPNSGRTGPSWPIDSETALLHHSLMLNAGPTGFTGSFPYQNVNNIQIGNSNANAGQNIRNIAIGDEAVGGTEETGLTGLAPGQNEYNIAIGYRSAFAGQDHGNIAIGNDAASFGGQVFENIAIGDQAAQAGQGYYNVAIGDDVVEGGQIDANVAIGTDAATNGQNNSNVAVGSSAAYFQDENNVAIGVYCGYEQIYGNVAIGYEAANNGQNEDNIAIGDNAAYWGQSVGAIAIGAGAAAGNGEGYQSDYSIAVGYSAGAAVSTVPEYSVRLGYQANVLSNYVPDGIQNTGVAIGTNASSSNGALVLNTDIDGLSGASPGLFIKPVRQFAPVSSHYVVNYDSSTNEICYKTQMISGVSGGGGPSGNGTVTFGITFASPPSVVATVINPGDTAGTFSVTIYNITTTSFNFYTRYVPTEGGSRAAGEGFNWIAMGYYLD